MNVRPAMFTDPGQLYEAVRTVAVRDRRCGRGDLPGRSGRVLALGSAVEDWLAIGRAEETVELLLRDAADPYARVIGRVIRHRDHPAGRGHYHGRTRVRVVAFRARPADRLRERLLGVRLNSCVEACHQVIARLRRCLTHCPCHIPSGIHRNDTRTRSTAKLRVVLLLESCLAHEIDAGEPSDLEVTSLHLLWGDGLQVAEHLRGVDTVDPGVVHDRLHLRAHAGKLLLVLHYLQRDPVRHLLVDRDRLVRRARPAGLCHAVRAHPCLLLYDAEMANRAPRRAV